MTTLGDPNGRRSRLPLRQGSGRVAAIRACVSERDFVDLRTALVDVVLNVAANAGAHARPADSTKQALFGGATAAAGPGASVLATATTVAVSAAAPAPSTAGTAAPPGAARTTAAAAALLPMVPEEGDGAEQQPPTQVVLQVKPRERPWRAKAAGSGRLAGGRAHQFSFDVSDLAAAAAAWEDQQRRAAEEARMAAAAEAAAAAAAAAQPAVTAVTPAVTPGGPAPSASHWSPIEGIPELRSRPRRPRPAAAAAAQTPAGPAFTPVEGVPETARGFRRPAAAAAPRFAFTPVEGVPEKALGTPTTAMRPPRAPAALAADAEQDDWSDGGGGDDYGDGGDDDDYGAGDSAGDSMAIARQHVSTVVQGIADASPETPSHPLRLATSNSARRSGGGSSRKATPGSGSRGGGAASRAVSAAADAAAGPSPLQLTPEVTAAAAEAEAAARRKRRYATAQTPREGRYFKSRKSLASEGTRIGEDGRRRSTRVRHAPLEYWRNEHKEFGRVHKSLPTVKRIAERTPDPAWPAPPAELLRRQAGRSKPRSKQAAAAAAPAAASGSDHSEQE